MFKKYALGACVALLAAGPAWGASITFSTFATTTDNPVIDTAPTVTVNDNTAGFLTFLVSIPNANGELSAIFVDLVGNPSVPSSKVASLTGGVSIVDYMEDTNDVGNGRNLSGNYGAPVNGPSGSFDIGFGFDDGQNGGAGRQISLPFSFTLDDMSSLTLASIARIALRFQSVGTLGQNGLGGDSEKLIAIAPDDTNVIPVPGAIWIMGAGLAGLGFAGRKRKKA